MVVRGVEGLVLACDASYRLRNEKSPNIKQVHQNLAVLIDPVLIHSDEDLHFGRKVLDGYLSETRSVPEIVSEFADQCRQYVVEHCSKTPTPPFGLIFAGIDPAPKGVPEIFGIHPSRDYQLAGYLGNVFGGPLNSIARFLDRKMHSPNITLTQAKSLSLFYILQSQLVFGFRRQLDPYACLATITYERGFEWVSDEELATMLERVSNLSNQVRSKSTNLFLQERI